MWESRLNKLKVQEVSRLQRKYRERVSADNNNCALETKHLDFLKSCKNYFSHSKTFRVFIIFPAIKNVYSSRFVVIMQHDLRLSINKSFVLFV